MFVCVGMIVNDGFFCLFSDGTTCKMSDGMAMRQ